MEEILQEFTIIRMLLSISGGDRRISEPPTVPQRGNRKSQRYRMEPAPKDLPEGIVQAMEACLIQMQLV